MITGRVPCNKLGSTGYPGEKGEMPVREGFLEGEMSKLTFERAGRNLERCVWGGGQRVPDRRNS